MASRQYTKKCACGESYRTKSNSRDKCYTCKPSRRKALDIPLGGPVMDKCSGCQHGYQYQPGQWGCAINAARICKPELFAKRWMARQVMTGEDGMKLGLDIDGTISACPHFYAFMARGIVTEGGEVHIISARAETDRGVTERHLVEWGFGDIPHVLHLYPLHYNHADPEELEAHFVRHAAWKAETCKAHGIRVLIDDDPRNLIACREAGCYTLSAGFVLPEVGA